MMIQLRPSQKHRRNGDQILSLAEDGKAIYKAGWKRKSGTCPILGA